MPVGLLGYIYLRVMICWCYAAAIPTYYLYTTLHTATRLIVDMNRKKGQQTSYSRQWLQAEDMLIKSTREKYSAIERLLVLSPKLLVYLSLKYVENTLEKQRSCRSNVYQFLLDFYYQFFANPFFPKLFPRPWIQLEQGKKHVVLRFRRKNTLFSRKDENSMTKHNIS